MHRSVTSLSLAIVLACLATSAVLGSEDAGDAARPSPDEALDTVFVDSAEIHLPADDRTEVTLVVSGSVPTACHHPAFEVVHAADAIRVWLWSVADDEGPCTAALEPVELTISLGVTDTGVPVLLEGTPVTHIVEAEAPAQADLVGAGWSFGMCLGYCSADLRLDNGAAVLSGHDRELEEPIFVNSGELTTEGRERVAVAVSGLDPSSLQPVYGCPDCADGGAGYLLLDQGGVVSRHDMELGAPPESMAGAQELASDIMAALEGCESSELIIVASECRAYVGEPE